MTAKSFKGFDYARGEPVELPRPQWRSHIASAAYTRRIGGDLLIYEPRANNCARLAFVIYDDDGELARPRSAN